MKIEWTTKAASDVARLRDFLHLVDPDAPHRVFRPVQATVNRLRTFPRLGERVDGFGSREVRRLIIGNYELRYELREDMIIILRVWHVRENRGNLN